MSDTRVDTLSTTPMSHPPRSNKHVKSVRRDVTRREPTQVDLRFSELCVSVRLNAVCSYGDKCLFAHSIEQLRPREQHSKYKTALCNNFHRLKSCPFGQRCVYIHDEFRIVRDNEVWLVSPNEGLVRVESGNNAAILEENVEGVNGNAVEQVNAAIVPSSLNDNVIVSTESAKIVNPTVVPVATPSVVEEEEMKTKTPSSEEESNGVKKSEKKNVRLHTIEVATTPASVSSIVETFGLKNVTEILPGTSFISTGNNIIRQITPAVPSVSTNVAVPQHGAHAAHGHQSQNQQNQVAQPESTSDAETKAALASDNTDSTDVNRNVENMESNDKLSSGNSASFSSNKQTINANAVPFIPSPYAMPPPHKQAVQSAQPHTQHMRHMIPSHPRMNMYQQHHQYRGMNPVYMGAPHYTHIPGHLPPHMMYKQHSHHSQRGNQHHTKFYHSATKAEHSEEPSAASSINVPTIMTAASSSIIVPSSDNPTNQQNQ